MRLSTLLTLLFAAPTLAVGTSHWSHTSEADFKKGKFTNVVATNLGDLKLSRAVKTLLEQDPRVSTVYCLAEGPDETIYAGTGPHGIILQLKGDKISTFATLDDENVFSLLIDKDGKLLAGTGGDCGRILRLDKPGEKPVEVFAAEGVQYVWQVRQTPDGNLYAATGPNGQIFQITPDGAKSVLLDTDDNNILSLISDGKDFLYAGTDPNGLVYKVNRKTEDVFVLFDAPEAEISALVLDANGRLYAGTGQAPEIEEIGANDRAATEKTGRPENTDKNVPLPTPAPRQPKSPAPPAPGNPHPIPIEPRSSIEPLNDNVLFFQELAPSPQPVGPPTPPSGGIRRRPMPGMPGAQPLSPIGNAIYRIDPNGFVTEIFRQGGMVLSLIEKDGTLLVGTGSEGLVYQVNPAAEETVVLAKVDPKQVMSLLAARNGRIILGLSNVGGIAEMSSGFAAEGSYTSAVLDAKQISRFGKLRLQGSLPPGSGLTVATRSGNLQEPGERGWSKWSAEMPATQYVQIPSPAARYFQYRLTFTSREGRETAVVDEVDAAYQLPNLPPQIKSIKVETAAPSAPPPPGPAGAKEPPSARMRQITWEAADPNADTLDYTLFFRNSPQGQWIQLQDKLRDPRYAWDTKSAPDGRYQVKVVASDARANPKGDERSGSRISDPIVVDNTPPAIGDLAVKTEGALVKVGAKVVDRGSSTASFEYSLDARDDWQTVAASDNIFDSPEEGVEFTIDGLAPGVHTIMLRASDMYGNQAHETVQLTISPPAGK